MEDPPREIAPIILSLTTTPPATQRHTIERYFLPTAAFDHPLCSVASSLPQSESEGSSSSVFSVFWPPSIGSRFYSATGLPSRLFIHAIYRWYKILSPVIELEVNSVAFDEKPGKERLYVDATQIFRFWFWPWVQIKANLVTVVGVEKKLVPRSAYPCVREDDDVEDYDTGTVRRTGSKRDRGSIGEGTLRKEGDRGDDLVERWFINRQKDLYQVEEWLGFVPIIGLFLRFWWSVFKQCATFTCFVGTTILLWLGMMKDHRGSFKEFKIAEGRDRADEQILRIERKVMAKLSYA